MSILTRSVSLDMLTSSGLRVAVPVFDAAGHDDGLSHDHPWARGTMAGRRAYPRVADTSRIRTPSSAIHDDIHYAS